MSNRILLIDFDARTLAKWRDVLGASGYDVVCAKNAKEATKHLDAHHRPGLVIVEPMMPGLDGFTLCRTLKSQRSNRPPAVVIASRIYRGQKYRGFARDAGADLFVEKPIGDNDLLDMVARWVDQDTTILRQGHAPAAAGPPADGAPIAAAAPEPSAAPPAAPPQPPSSPGVTSPMQASNQPASSNRTMPIQLIRRDPAPTADIAGPPTAPVGLNAGPDSGIDLGSMSDDDIDDALSRLSLGGLDDALSPAPGSAAAAAPIPLDPPGGASPSDSGSFSADDLAQALDRLELTSDEKARPAADAEDADTALIEISPDEDDDPAVGARLERETGEKAHAAPPGFDDPPFFARTHPGRPGEGSPPPSAGRVRLDAGGARPLEPQTRVAREIDDALTLAGLSGPVAPAPSRADGETRGTSPVPPPHEPVTDEDDTCTGGTRTAAAPAEPVDDEGLPLPPWRDPEVSLSREFEMVPDSCALPSDPWTEDPAPAPLDLSGDADALAAPSEHDPIDVADALAAPVADDTPVDADEADAIEAQLEYEPLEDEAAHSAPIEFDLSGAPAVRSAPPDVPAPRDENARSAPIELDLDDDPFPDEDAPSLSIEFQSPREPAPVRVHTREDPRDVAPAAPPAVDEPPLPEVPARTDAAQTTAAAQREEAERFAAADGDTGQVDLVSAIDRVLRLVPRDDAPALPQEPARDVTGAPGPAPGEALAPGSKTATPPTAEPARHTGPLRGMDPETAELLSTLEELEDSLPPEVLSDRPRESLVGPASREQELELDSLMERVTGRQAAAGPLAVGVPPVTDAEDRSPAPRARDEAKQAAVDAYYEEILTSASTRRAGPWIGVLVALVVVGGALIGLALFRGEEGTPATPDHAARPDASAAPGAAAPTDANPPVETTERPPVRAIPDDVPGAAGPATSPSASRSSDRADGSARTAAPQARAPRVERPAPAPARETTTIGGVRGSLPPAPEPLGRTAPADGSIPIVPLAEIDRPLTLLEFERPRMPEPAKRAGARGRVFVQVLVGPEGNVLDTKAMMDPGHGLADAARRSVKGWRYSRPSRDLEPVRVWKTEVVEFTNAD